MRSERPTGFFKNIKTAFKDDFELLKLQTALVLMIQADNGFPCKFGMIELICIDFLQIDLQYHALCFSNDVTIVGRLQINNLRGG